MQLLKYKAIIFFLFASNVIVGQAEIPFPDSNAVWNIGVYDVYGAFHYCYTYSIGSQNNDTIIGGTTYKKVFYSDSVYINIYKGAVKQSTDRKVFFIPHDSLTEKILYDFGANTGDTVKNVYSDFTGSEPQHDEEILDVDSILIAGIYHKRLLLNLNLKWIEGIGSTGGLFESTYGGTFSIVYKLDCFSINGTTLYERTANSCTAASINNYITNIGDVHIFPNPASNQINIQLIKPGPLNFKLYNSSGICVYTKNNTTNIPMLTFDALQFSNGLYLYEVEINNYLRHGKIIITH